MTTFIFRLQVYCRPITFSVFFYRYYRLKYFNLYLVNFLYWENFLISDTSFNVWYLRAEKVSKFKTWFTFTKLLTKLGGKAGYITLLYYQQCEYIFYTILKTKQLLCNVEKKCAGWHSNGRNTNTNMSSLTKAINIRFCAHLTTNHNIPPFTHILKPTPNKTILWRKKFSGE